MHKYFPASFSKELETAVDLAHEAGMVILKHYGAKFSVDYKDSAKSDPVTQADKDANDLIVAGLQKVFPDDGILAEESTDDLSRQQKSRLWCVDPLDGTKEFVDKNGQFVVMIGLAIDGKATLGVVYQPTQNLLWWGADGQAFQVSAGEHIEELNVSQQADPAEASMVVSRSHRSPIVTGVAERLGIKKEIPLGSVGLKISRIIRGQADCYVSVTDRTREWDACAPEAILRAAGGEMTDIAGRQLQYNKDETNTTYGMLATNGALHPLSVEALRPVVQDKGW